MNQPFYLIAGLGKTGHSIARYLRRRNIPFVVFDTRADLSAGLEEFHQAFPGVDVFLKELPSTVYPQLTGIIARLGIPLMGDIECLAREVNAPVIAITGTNGKSTVTTLVGEMAKMAGLNVAVAGNIGLPVLDLLDDDQDYDLWVLELSSFQLDLTHSLAPIAATILNITPDHLDRHHSLAAYRAAKQRIYRGVKHCLYNREDRQTFPDHAVNAGTSFGLDQPEEGQWGIKTQAGKNYLAYGNDCILACEDLRLKGMHNWQNALAACALARVAGIEMKVIIAVLKIFAGLPHRCQWVRTLNGVDWINDSKGTNVGATISAIAGVGSSIAGKIVLIAGGLGKGADFSELRNSVSAFVRSVILIGADAAIIAEALSGTVPVFAASSLGEAVNLAQIEAKSKDVVLLSPACASQDMFRDFNHRGETFAHLVELL